MITFTKKTDPISAPKEPEENRFETTRKAAKELHRKSDTDGTSRRKDQMAGETKLI
ncbi:hypothetical protein [Aquibium carbonis]|uniref:hypothetical protein n=1 Tax=Aquibium carbonis TaxID=2495581 RepID=UPI00147839FF|nr:hypothetical protein [Aquibium carbonis]